MSWGGDSWYGPWEGGGEVDRGGGLRISPWWEPFDPPSERTPAWKTWYCDGLECKQQYGGNASTDPNTFSSKAECELECPTETGSENTGAGWICEIQGMNATSMGATATCVFVESNSKFTTEEACRAECSVPSVLPPFAGPTTGGGGYAIPIPGSTHRGPGVTEGGMPMGGLTHGDYTHPSQSSDPDNRYYCDPPGGSLGEGVCLVCPQDEDGHFYNPGDGYSCDTLEDCQQVLCGVPGCNYETWDCRLYGAVGQEWGQCSMRMDCAGMFTDEQACKDACEGPPEDPGVPGHSGPWTDPDYDFPGNPPTQPTTPGG